jgi:Spy/CpxP family protein refolding chaperone
MSITTLRRSLLLLSLGSAVLVPSLLAATDTPPPPPHHHGAGPHEASFDPEQRLARLTEKLNLTADQQTKIRPLLVAQAEAMKAIDNAALTGDQRREKLKALRKDNRAKIGEILTSEQRKLLRQEFRKHRGHKGHAAPPPSPAPAN